MEDNCFEIIKVKDVEAMLKEEARDLDDSDGFLNTNLCLIYKINPSKVAVVPNSVLAEQDCILFTNNECYQEALKMDQFPIENEYITIYEENKHYIDRISDVKFLIAEINQSLDTEIDCNDLSERSLQSILNTLKNRKFKKSVRLKTVYLFGLLVGNLICKEKNAVWILEKKYGTYNPYYIPLLINDENKLSDFFGKIESIEKWKEYDYSFLRKSIDLYGFKHDKNSFESGSLNPTFYNTDFSEL